MTGSPNCTPFDFTYAYLPSSMLAHAIQNLARMLDPTQLLSILEDHIQSFLIPKNLRCSNALLVNPMGARLSELCLSCEVSLQQNCALLALKSATYTDSQRACMKTFTEGLTKVTAPDWHQCSPAVVTLMVFLEDL